MANMKQFHSLSSMLPMMQPDEYQALKEDIKINGLQVPITIFKDGIIDGRHRAKACDELGVQPKYQDFQENGISAADYIIIHNLNRRHLNTSQKAVVALSYLDQLKPEFLKRKHDKGNGKGERSSIVCAKRFGIGKVVVEFAQRVRKDRPELLKRVMEGRMTINQAYRRIHPKEKKIEPTIDSALTLLHSKLKEGWTIEMKMKKDCFQVHVSGDGISPIRLQMEWSDKPVFEKFYEAINVACKQRNK